MILKIKPQLITDVALTGELTTSPISNGTIMIYNKDGAAVYANSMGDTPSIVEDADSFVTKDSNDYALDCKIYKAANDIIIRVPLTFVFDSCSIGIRITTIDSEGETLVFYKMFNIYGYDLQLKLGLNHSTLDEPISTFVAIEHPITNTKSIYKTNNSYVTSLAYYINGIIKSGEQDFSTIIHNTSEIYMYSEYRIPLGNNRYTVKSHTSPIQTLHKFQVKPDIFIEKSINTIDATLNSTVDISVNIDFSKQVKYWVNDIETNVGKNYGLIISLYDYSETLVARHIDIRYITFNDASVNVQVPTIQLTEAGKHRIEVEYVILGQDVHRGMISYPPGDYIIAYTTDANLIVGDITSITDNITKSSNLTLMPCITSMSGLEFNQFYREPFHMNVTNNSDEILLHSANEQINLTGGSGVVAVKPVYGSIQQDELQVYELIKVEQVGNDKIQLENISSERLYVTITKFNDDSVNQDIELLPSKSNTITLADGVYNIKSSTSNNPNTEDYVINHIIVLYPTLLQGEVTYMQMLMNDCIGKEIDYRDFYDFVSFNFLTDVFYKMLANVTNFYYIYRGELSLDMTNQIYTLDDILVRIHEYMAKNDKRIY